MVRPNSRVRESTGVDGRKQDDTDQENANGGSPESEPIIGARTTETVSRIAEDLERITKEIENNFVRMSHTLDRMTDEIKETQKCIDNTISVFKKL